VRPLLLILALLPLPGCIFVADIDDDGPRRATPAELAAAREVLSASDVRGVRDLHAAQLAALEPGTPVARFRESFPDAVFVESRQDGDARTDAYSVRTTDPYHLRGKRTVRVHEDEAWFFFRNDQLIKWGPANFWP